MTDIPQEVIDALKAYDVAKEAFTKCCWSISKEGYHERENELTIARNRYEGKLENFLYRHVKTYSKAWDERNG